MATIKATDIYVTDEVGNFAKQNPSFDIGDIYHSTLIIAIAATVAIFSGRLLWASLAKALSSGSISSQSESKEKFKALAISGVLLVLVLSVFSYLNIFNLDFFLKPLSGGAQPGQSVLPDTIGAEPDGGGSAIDPSNTPALLELMKSTEGQVRSTFPQSIQINKSACTTLGQTNCTSVGGMSNVTIAMLMLLQAGCSCNLVITGGSEWWTHSATTKHRPGNSTAVDIRFDVSGVNDFITTTGGFKRETPWNICNSAYSWKGFYFCDERGSAGGARHWHIQPL